MNIGIVTTWFERGAAYVSRAYKEVLEEEHQVFIYARAGEKYAQGDPRWDGPQVTWGARVKRQVDTWIDPTDFERFLEKNHIDALLFNEQQSWDILVHLKKTRPKLPLGAYIDYYTAQTVPFFEVYDFLICNTRRHHSVFSWHPRAYFIPWGTDVELFKPAYIQPARELTFFHSCGMDPHRKGTEAVVRAFAQLTGQARLFIHSQVELSAPVQQIAQQNPARIEIHQGEVTAPGLYHRGDVYVYPTSLEGIGLTITEALSCGLPVIVTDNGPMNEWVQNEKNGFLIEVERFQIRSDGYYWPESFPSQESLRAAMQKCIEGADELPAMRQAALDYARRELDWQRNGAQLLSLIRDIKGKGIDAKLDRIIARHEQMRRPRLWKRVARRLGAARVKNWLSKSLERIRKSV